MQVGLGPGHIVLDGDPGLPPPKGHSRQFWAHVYCAQTATWTKMPLAMEEGLDPSDIVLDGTQFPLPKNGAELPNFRPVSVVTKPLHRSRCHLELR